MQEIHHCPVDGGALRYDTVTRTWSPCPVEEFLALRESEEFIFKRTMRQGHSRFHGRVDIYHKAAT